MREDAHKKKIIYFKNKNHTFVVNSMVKKCSLIYSVMKIERKISLLSLVMFCTLILFYSCGTKQAVVLSTSDTQSISPKREFRGAWIHTVGQSRYAQMNSSQMKLYFSELLDSLQSMGINAVIFQIRPQADAFYKSRYEPWSRYLSGIQGVGVDNNFDPLEYLVEEAHKRCMELHAWLNPYRVTTSLGQPLADSHIYHREPWRFVQYGSQIYFDPGIPQNRLFICQVVEDIVLRYNVDAIHMDDYFYPYPIAGEDFPDDESFRTYAHQQGFLESDRANWRRNNVNMLIKEIKQTINNTKPWVRFGISPFGIYRNKENTPDGSGSNTRGLQNYDDLYADVKLWVEKGWIDYNIPQIYWEIGHPVANYRELVPWWATNNYGSHLYIGQDVKRTMDKTDIYGDSQLYEKMQIVRSLPNLIHGNCFWYGYIMYENYKEIGTLLKHEYHKYPALIPAYKHMHGGRPRAVKNLSKVYFSQYNHVLLHWKAEGDRELPDNARYFVVYRFAKGEKVDIEKASNIVAITPHTEIILDYKNGKQEYKYVITAVDAFHNESKPKEIKVKL